MTFAYLLAQILNERGAVTKIERSSGKWHVLTNIKAEETQQQEQVQEQQEQPQNLMPLLYKWLELKKEHPEEITLLQDNEEYITFGQQAEDTADILKLILTKAKGCSYTAFPADKINEYMHLFIKAGKTIALCNNPL